MKQTKMLLAAFFLLFFGFSQTILAQKDAAVSYPAVRNEKFTIQALQQILAAQATYFSTAGNNTNYATFQQLANEGLIDPVLASGSKYGYFFTLTVQNPSPPMPANFTVVAVPQLYRRTGVRSFFIDSNGLIRGGDKQGAAANRNDPLIEEMYTCASLEECETRAISSLRVLASAEATYYSTTGNNSLYGSLCQLEQAMLIDQLLASGSKYGYYFVVVPRAGTNQQYASYKALAIPRDYPNTGRRSFLVDETGVVRGADRNGAPAGADDPPIN